MSENKKPRICEVLGVEVGEEFAVDNAGDGKFRVNEEGVLQYYSTVYDEFRTSIFHNEIIDAINRPENIIHKKKSRWTAEDIADAKAVRRMFPDAVELERVSLDGVICVLEYDDRCFAEISENTFPSLASYETVKIDEILEAENG